MKVVVFGATGATGRLTLRKLLAEAAAFREVVAVARNPAALDDVSEGDDGGGGGRLRAVRGDLQDAASLREPLRGADVVVFLAGPRTFFDGWSTFTKFMSEKCTVYSQGGKNVLEGMKEMGVKRLVAVTSLGVVDDPTGPWLYNHVIRPFLLWDMYQDMARFEDLIKSVAAASDGSLSYTIVRPTQLLDGPVAGGKKPVTGEGSLALGSLHQVDRADLAELLARLALDKGEYDNKTIFLSA